MPYRNTTNSSPGVIAILAVVTVALGALLGVIAIYGEDSDLTVVISYLAVAVPVIIGFGFNAAKQDQQNRKQDETTEHVAGMKGSLNGKLDKRFSDLENNLTAKIATNSSPTIVNVSDPTREELTDD